MKNTMILVSSAWNNVDTFRLIPISLDCPYIEGIYDKTVGVLAMLGKDKKETYQMLPKLDSNGDVIYTSKKRSNGLNYKEEKTLLVSNIEYYIVKESEIIDFINRLADNANEYDFNYYLNEYRQAQESLKEEENKVKEPVLQKVED